MVGLFLLIATILEIIEAGIQALQRKTIELTNNSSFLLSRLRRLSIKMFILYATPQC